MSTLHRGFASPKSRKRAGKTLKGMWRMDVTELLVAWREGTPDALERLVPVVYPHLRRLAQSQMNQEDTGHTLQATALVHELYLRLVDQRHVNWRDRAHFFGVAAKLMRRILVDHARRKGAAKRGGEQAAVPLDTDTPVVLEDSRLLALESALSKLEKLDPRKVQVVELRFFGGLSNREISEFLQVSDATVERDWAAAKAWLYRELDPR